MNIYKRILGVRGGRGDNPPNLLYFKEKKLEIEIVILKGWP